jgi:DNA-binding NarL/FixJ family response regulator
MGTNGGPRPRTPHPDPITSGCRLVVADDDVLLREGLASLLERAGFEVVGLAGDGTRLLDLVHELNPDLALVDIRMPPNHSTEGLEAARLIRRDHPEIGIVVLSAHVELEHAMELLSSGTRTGYLLKGRVTDVDEFVETLHRVARGGSVVDPLLVQELVATHRRDDPLAALSSREREVLSLMAEGRSNAGIARRLWVAEGTGLGRQLRVVLCRVGGHEDHPPAGGGIGEAVGEREAALGPEIDIHEDDVRIQLLRRADTLRGRSGSTDHVEALSGEERPRRFEKRLVVVDKQVAHGLEWRITPGPAGRIAASGNRELTLARIADGRWP